MKVAAICVPKNGTQIATFTDSIAVTEVGLRADISTTRFEDFAADLLYACGVGAGRGS